jgi:hypothetical protein
MPFTTDNILEHGDLEVIIGIDSALDVTPEEYQEYLQTLDESLLKFKEGEEPSRFVMKRHVPEKHALKIEDKKLSVKTDGDSVALGMSYLHLEVAATLKDIKYPDYVPEEKRIKLKFTGDGLVQSHIIEQFHSANIIKNLATGRQNYLKKFANPADVKKS